MSDDGAAGQAAFFGITGLNKLEDLNVYGTQVRDAGLESLHSLPKLRHFFVWQTKVTKAGVARRQKAIPQVQVVPGPPTRSSSGR